MALPYGKELYKEVTVVHGYFHFAMDSQRLRCKKNMSASVLVTAEKEEDGNECTPSLYLMKNTSAFGSTPWTSALKFTCTPVSDSELPETVNLCCSDEMFSPVKRSIEIIIDENAGPCECGKNFIEDMYLGSNK